MSDKKPFTDANETAEHHNGVWRIVHAILGVIEEIAQAWRHDDATVVDAPAEITNLENPE